MATDQEVRKVLREEGIQVTERGKLGQDYHDQYEAIVEGRGVSAPADPPAPPIDDPAGNAPASAERRPRRATPRGKPRSLWQRISAGTSGGGGGKRAKARPRVPVDRLCERAWETLARLAGQGPLGRCLTWQSPVAGLIMEDVVAGTVADRALQPIARAEAKSEKVLALFGPPMIVAALQAAQGLPDEQRALREAFLIPMLRESMVLCVDVAGDKMAAKAERDAERGPAYQEADRLIAMMFAPPTPAGPAAGDDQHADQVADAAARNAQAFATA
jgi:hypothetical protein